MILLKILKAAPLPKNQIADLSVTVDSTGTSNPQLHSVISSTVPITQKAMLQVSTIP